MRRRIVASTLLPVVVPTLVVGCRGEPRASPIEVAVAANFAGVAAALARDFEARTGDSVRIAVGATGGLYAQIVNGAPFHLFLSADAERPRRLEEEGLAVPGTRFVYAVGRLTVYAPRLEPGWETPAVLSRPELRVAWANPRTAPYGVAAVEALEAWDVAGIEGAVGESVGQVLQFVRSGAADVGFVALAQVLEEAPEAVRLVPPELYAPLRQEAVLLVAGAERADARAFLEFLRSPPAAERIRAGGYEVPEGPVGGG